MKINHKLADTLAKKIKQIYKKSLSTAQPNINYKERTDIVTSTDLFLEQNIIKLIRKLFPEHSIYAEESGEIKKASDYEWFIDPLDGTINYSCNIPLYSTSVALKKGQDIIFGLIIDHSRDDVYCAIKDQGAYCNNKKISVSKRAN